MTQLHEIELFQGANGKFFYRPIANNGEQVYQSQGYSTKWNAKRAAAKMHPGVRIVDLDAPVQT